MNTESNFLGRFSDPSLLILSSLASGPKHGYAMIEDIAAFSGTQLEPGTLYGALARLERRGWIEALTSEGQSHPYRITPGGEVFLQRHYTTARQRLERIGVTNPDQLYKEKPMNPLIWIIRLYPRQWRERYEEEMIALLEQHQVTPATLIDLMLGALDTRLDPYYRSRESLFGGLNLRSIALVFITMLSIVTFATYLWAQETRNLLIFPFGIYNTMTPFLNIEYLLLLIITFCITGGIIRKALIARKRGTLLAAATCLLLCSLFVILEFLGGLSSPLPNLFDRTILLTPDALWKLLTIDGMFVFLFKLRETIATRQIRPLLLVALFLPLCLILFLNPALGSERGIFEFGLLSVKQLAPFLGLGSIFLAMDTSDMSQAASRLYLLLPATLLTLLVTSTPIVMFMWYLNFWGVALFSSSCRCKQL
ncbi:hypothetical protein KDH_57980 [Dictyobacter sp. S3.2.2.5]|uniref:Transcription regulator PadR N-terminal domain-containing protein n=1 Tax=Dictyobacter halimunensis TaxID=3026934 RepID=A0ABQ6FXF9_9CHLR|nr:hypothetical protein KDH_57980 [Dictyobacter sp. S3.2.2.5]